MTSNQKSRLTTMLYQPEILIACLGVFKGEAIFASKKIAVGS